MILTPRYLHLEIEEEVYSVLIYVRMATNFYGSINDTAVQDLLQQISLLLLGIPMPHNSIGNFILICVVQERY